MCTSLWSLQGGRSGERRRIDPVIKEASGGQPKAPSGSAANLALPVPAWPARLAAQGGLAPILLPSPPALDCTHPILPHASSPLQAAKRGLDVGKLHGSRTPAWRNLRGRSAPALKKSYFEGGCAGCVGRFGCSVMWLLCGCGCAAGSCVREYLACGLTGLVHVHAPKYTSPAWPPFCRP